MVSFERYDTDWHRVLVDGKIVGGLGKLANGCWKVYDSSDRALSRMFAKLPDAKAFARGHF